MFSSATHDYNSTNLHQVTPSLSQASFRLAGDLPGTCLATQLPEEFSYFH
jgi:hypothetical protein